MQLPLVPLQHRVPSSRRAAPVKYVRPSLPQHHRAPTTTGCIEPTAGTPRMHNTFHGLDAPGDTQPDSQMHKQYTSGIYSSISAANNIARVPKSLFVDHTEEGDVHTPTQGLDAVNSSQESVNRAATSPTTGDANENGLFAHNSLAPTSPLKFETPALGGRKRDNFGDALSSARRTNTSPGTVASVSAFAAGFGAFDGASGMGGGPQISLTQAFNNTQAPTSPVVGPASEDVVFQRPSPNFSHARHSSPIPAYSSPIKAPRPETPKSDPIARSSSEPRSEYVTLKESQNRRGLLIENTKASGTEEQDNENSWNELSRRIRARKRKEDFHRRAARSLSHVSAPPTTTSLRPRKKRAPHTTYPSPDWSRAGRSMGHEDEMQEEKDDTDDDGASQVSLRATYITEVNATSSGAARVVIERSSNDNRVQVPKTSSHPGYTPSGQTSRNPSQLPSPSFQLQRQSQSRASNSQALVSEMLRQPNSSRESVAVMDSQPDVFAGFDSIPPPKSLRFPSSPSTNQYSIHQTSVLQAKAGYTSQIVSSSMPPLPPNSSSNEVADIDEDEGEFTLDEDRVPSSPPILTHDEDGGNSECGYDEYAEEILDQGVPDSPQYDYGVASYTTGELPTPKDDSEDDSASPTIRTNFDQEEFDPIQSLKVDMDVNPEALFVTGQELRSHSTFSDDENVANEQLHSSAGYGETPRVERQNTIPETDALEETQPSVFVNGIQIDQHDRCMNSVHDTNSTNDFHTACEEQSGSQSRQIPYSSKTENSDVIATGQRIRSMNDIYNLPNTQQSAVEEEVEMPQLSGLNQEDEIGSSMPPSAKRRKFAHATRSTVFFGSVKPSTGSEALSDPPSSPVSEKRRQIGTSPSNQEKRASATATHTGDEASVPYRALATLKSKIGSRQPKRQGQKNGSLKPVSRELLRSLSSPGHSPPRPRNPPAGQQRRSLTPTKASTNAGSLGGDVDMPDAGDESDELAGLTPYPQNVEQALERLSQREVSPLRETIVPNRVFASWPGSHYYPATCLGHSSSSRQLRVRFDDGNTTMLDAVHIRALELRIGDHVKVDEQGMKKNTYIVAGFKDKINDVDGLEFPITDRFGHATVIVEEKRRESLPQTSAIQPSKHIPVPIGIIYLTTGLWGRLRDRVFKYSAPSSPEKPTSRIGTPILESVTSPSIIRRNIAIPQFLKDATTRATSVASTTRSGSGIFSNMAFVLTSTAADVDKEAIAKLLKTNGGLVLEQGFHELFEFSEPEISSSQDQNHSTSQGSRSLVIKNTYNDLGFVALLSDSHSRSTKYIQALALNVPCLHLRWVQDSLSSYRAKPISRYLLPAGVSKFLDPNGIVRSRTMHCYDPAAEETTFSQMVQDRDLLLRGQNVLLVTGKSKKEIERRQPFIFLTHAIGAANVDRCVDLAAASDMLTDGHHWDWIYVDNGESGVADAAAELFGIERPESTAKSKKGKKRKREETDTAEELMVAVEMGGRKFRITCSEFVIQSLILGALIEE